MKKLLIVPSLLAIVPSIFAQTSMPWDSLRPLSEIAVASDPFVKGLVLIISLVLFTISFLAYQKTKTKKMMFVTLAFTLFTIKWIIKIIDMMYSPGYFFSDASQNVAELLIFVFLFLALFHKKVK